MAESKGYFQFPLSLLAFGKDYKQRLETIVSYCLCEQASRTNPKFPRSARYAPLDDAATFLGVEIGSYEDTLIEWKAGDSFVCQWERRHGKDARVRIATSLFWEAYNNTGLSYREFSILCAINSAIGSRSTPVRITEPSVRVRAAGFKSWDVAKSELPSDESRKARLLTEHEVRYTLQKLHQRQLFARARVGAKRSNTCSESLTTNCVRRSGNGRHTHRNLTRSAQEKTLNLWRQSDQRSDGL